jgi:type IV secretory pathway VirB6-like protein
MRGRLLLLVIALLFAGRAQAQTGGINPIPLIIQYESSGNPTATSSSSSASGLFQDLTGTWAQALSDCGCGTTGQYPTAANAPASVQIAANSALIDQQGLSPWLCSGCDTAFTNAVAAAGGAGAFQTSGLSTNPTDYAAADSAGGLAGLFGGAATTSGSTIATNSGGITVTAASVSSTPGTLSSPFSWEWNQIVSTTQNAVQGEIQAIQLMVAHYLPPLLVLAVIVLGISTWLGGTRYDTLVGFALRLVLVMPLVAGGSQLYQNWVVQPVMGLPAWWQSWVISGIGGAGGGLSSPVSVLDQVYNAVSSAADKMASTASPWHVAHAIEIVFVGLTAKILTGLGLAAMFLAIAVTTVLTFVALIVGPIIIPLTLFAVTRQVFWSWAGVLGTLLLSLLAVDIMLTLYEANMTAMLGAMTLSGTPDTDAPSVIALGIMIFILGSSVVFVPAMMARIGGGVAAALDGAAWYLAGGPVRAAASASLRMVGRRWGLS